MELLERVVELSLEGYCCSQVMALLLLELLGEEDDGFVRAMGGLINGGGYSGGDCGCMSGGACLISYITTPIFPGTFPRCAILRTGSQRK